jgi:bifunctional non-homologous end joining protein LigD
MLRGTVREVLPAEARAQIREIKQPAWFSPMLATLTAEPFSLQGWLFEPALMESAAWLSAAPRPWSCIPAIESWLNPKYPELIDPFRGKEVASFIMGGEIVTFEGGVTSFAKLQQRMEIQHPPDALQRRVPVWFYAFDLLYLDLKVSVLYSSNESHHNFPL